jgi:hypothetical protein
MGRVTYMPESRLERSRVKGDASTKPEFKERFSAPTMKRRPETEREDFIDGIRKIGRERTGKNEKEQ